METTTTTHEATVEGRKVLVEVDTRRTNTWDDRRAANKKDRAFFDFGSLATPAPDGPACTEEGCSCGGRETDHKVHAAWLRAESKKARAVLAQVVGGEFTFSRYAGCSCPCSPGFITRGNSRGAMHFVRILD